MELAVAEMARMWKAEGEDEGTFASEPSPKGDSFPGTATMLSKSCKRTEMQQELGNVSLGETELKKDLQFKHFGIAQSVDGDPLTPINHRVKFQRKRLNLFEGHLPTPAPTRLKLRRWCSNFMSALRLGCESWVLNNRAQKRITAFV